MTNIVQNLPGCTVKITVETVNIDLVPREIVEKLFDAATKFVWMADDEECQFESETAKKSFVALQDAVNEACRYSGKETHEIQADLTTSAKRG